MQPIHRFGPEKLILIGASARAATQSARRAGLQPIAIDLFGDLDTRAAAHDFIDLRQVFGQVRVSGKEDPLSEFCDPRIPATMVGDFDGCTDLLAKLTRPVIGNQRSHWSQVRDPQFLRDVARLSGVHFPTTFLTEPQDAQSRQRWLRKDVQASGGLGVSWNRDLSLGLRTKQSTPNHSPGNTIWQKWMPGKAYGASYIADGRQAAMLGVCRSRFHRCGHRPFVYLGSTSSPNTIWQNSGRRVVSKQTVSRLETLGERVAFEANLKCLFNVDVLVCNDQITLLEINPRWSSSMELLDRFASLCSPTPVSLLGDAVRLSVEGCPLEDLACVGALTSPTRQTSSVVFDKRIVYARHDGRVRLQKLTDIASSNFSIADIPHDEEVIRKDEPITTLVSTFDRSKDRPVAWLRKRKHTIRAIQDSLDPGFP